jgi:hypothetical protein
VLCFYLVDNQCKIQCPFQHLASFQRMLGLGGCYYLWNLYEIIQTAHCPTDLFELFPTLLR